VRAAYCRSYGPPEVVQVEDVPAAEVGPGQVRVRLGAAAVNFPDVLLVAGEYQIRVPPPFVPGSEWAGTVAEVAGDVSGVAVGDVVAGTGIVGAFAEEAVVPASSVWAVPAGVDVRAAAAFGVAHRTAYNVLRSVAEVSAGDEVVVLGAGGGVGLAAVQLATALGASVTAVASSAEKLEVAASFGAARGVNHAGGDLRSALKAALPDGADVVVDPVGGDLSEPAYRSMRWGGRFVTVGFAAGIPKLPLNLVLLKGAAVLGFQFIDYATHRAEEMARNERELLALLADGKATPHVGAVFPLDEAAAALRYVADGKAVGKVVIDIAG
jgi:NADPH2:quinone reductase